MSGVSSSSTPDGLETAAAASADEALAMSLAIEEVAISKRVRRTLVRASRTTSVKNQAVTADLDQEQVVIERIPVGRVVEATPPVRQEGDVTIMPVMEEEVVIVRRLVLKEEIHLRRVRTTRQHVEVVSLREQVVNVTRTPLED